MSAARAVQVGQSLAPVSRPTRGDLRAEIEAAITAIRVNGAMVSNLLDALRPEDSVRHVALVTGLKHYLGPFVAYGMPKSM